MYWRISLVLLIFVGFACKKESKVLTENSGTKLSEYNSQYLIEVDELLLSIKNSNLKIVDMRKADEFKKHHIPGALNIQRYELENDSFPFEGMMANSQQIEKLFRKIGIKNSDTIIIYDDNGLCEASRLWWVLQYYNFNQVKLLHGGINEWKAKGGQLTEENKNVEKSEFALPRKLNKKYFASYAEIKVAISKKSIILDTRSAIEYSGEKHKKGAYKAGRIPNSLNLNWAETINFSGNKKFKSRDSLEHIFKKLNLDKEEQIIVYCHSGVRSSHTTFVLSQLLGYNNVKNYDGSWIEWSYFDSTNIFQDL
ncbi:sulfurtransferase [Hyphobacterium sp. CCMP332]|nr:sulfurtransferase [Hyphobacterium sp. CCMP332]